MTSVTDKKNSNTNEQIEEYKKLIISKDNEISKLNDINLSKENEIKRLNKMIEDMKAGSVTQEMEENFKKEKEKLLAKINNLELKIYNINDEKNKLNSENKKLNEELNTSNSKKKGKKNKENKNNDDNNKDNTDEKNTIQNENEKDKFKINYEELLKMKEDIEIQNKKLIEEIKSLKESQAKDNTGNDNQIENNNSNNINKNNVELNYKIEELQKIIEDYKKGKIIPETTKKTIDSVKNNRLSEIDELKKKFELLNIKNKNYESKIKSLNDNISSNTKNKKDLETIIFKQENKINELNSLIKKKDNSIRSKEASISKNETYSLQLMNIIKEQKLQIQNIKKQKKEEDLSQIAELKRQITNLENTVELKENAISNLKKTHKNLQDKYIKLCFNIKKQEQDNLLNQAKLLKQQKLARDAMKGQNKYISKYANNNNLQQLTEDSNGISDLEYPNLNTNSNIISTNMEKEKKENNSKSSNDIVLPVISPNNSVKIEENLNSYKDSLIIDEGNKLDEINDMMKKVIEEN